MKKYFYPLVSVSLFLLVSSYKQNDDPTFDPYFIGKWTGTITFVEKYTGITGNSERFVTVSFINALPTLYRNIETTYLYFTDDKGTGSAKYHGEAIIGGKKMGMTDCEGNGPAELHAVVINFEDSTYDIEAIGPDCVGISVSTIDGSTEPYGPDRTSLIVSGHRLGDDRAEREQAVGDAAAFDTQLGVAHAGVGRECDRGRAGEPEPVIQLRGEQQVGQLALEVRGPPAIATLGEHQIVQVESTAPMPDA